MIEETDELLINRGNETFKVTVKDVEDYVNSSSKIKDGELSVKNFDGSIEVKKFSANRGSNSLIRFMRGFIVGSGGDVRLDKTEILNNLIEPENGQLYAVGNNNSKKLSFRANSPTDFTIEFTNSKVVNTSTGVKVKISRFDIEWTDVVDLPKCFKPCDHMHDLDDFGQGDINWEDMPICDECIVYCGEPKPPADCSNKFCAGRDYFTVKGDAECKNTIVFTSDVSQFRFTNINAGLYEVDFEVGDKDFQLEITATGQNCNPASVGILTRLDRNGKTLYIEDYGNDPNGDMSFDDLVIIVNEGYFEKLGDHPNKDKQTVIYRSSPSKCPSGCECISGICVPITRSSYASGGECKLQGEIWHGGEFNNKIRFEKDDGSHTVEYEVPKGEWFRFGDQIEALETGTTYKYTLISDCTFNNGDVAPDCKWASRVAEGGRLLQCEDLATDPNAINYTDLQIRLDSGYGTWRIVTGSTGLLTIPDKCPCNGVICPDCQECVNGRCVDKCAPGQICQGGVCKDPLPGDPCDGVVCPDCHECVNGNCVDKCAPGQICKGGVCKDTSPIDPCDGKEYCYTIDINCVKNKLGL